MSNQTTQPSNGEVDPLTAALYRELNALPTAAEHYMGQLIDSVDAQKVIASAVVAGSLATGIGSHLAPAGANELKPSKPAPVVIAPAPGEAKEKANTPQKPATKIVEYKVTAVPNDNATKMSREHNMSLNQFYALNPKVANTSNHWLYTGDSYTVTRSVPLPSSVKQSTVHYQVTAKPGDTATETAKDHNMSLAEFYQLNPNVASTSNHWLYIGDKYNVDSPAKSEIKTVVPNHLKVKPAQVTNSAETKQAIERADHGASDDIIINAHKLFVNKAAPNRSTESHSTNKHSQRTTPQSKPRISTPKPPKSQPRTHIEPPVTHQTKPPVHKRPIAHVAKKTSQTPEKATFDPYALSAAEVAEINSLTNIPQYKRTFMINTIPAARRVAAMYHINAAVMEAQAIDESDAGRAAPHNNFFGIKGTGPAGSFYMHTKEDNGHGQLYTITDKFRAYYTPQESFTDYALFIHANPAYYGDAVANYTSWRGYLNGLQNGPANYATSTAYVRTISSIVEGYHLDSLTHSQP